MAGTVFNRIRWWHWIVALDALFIIATVVGPYLPRAIGRDLRVASTTSLGSEMTLAAWWAGAVLLLAALLAYDVASRRNGRDGTAWLVVSALFAGLSLDEVGSLHERIMKGGWLSLAPVALVGGVVFAYALWRLTREPSTRKAAALIGLAVALFASVAGMEYIELQVTWPTWMRGVRTGIEEGTELLAAAICLGALVGVRGRVDAPAWQQVIPDPSRFANLRVLLFAGLIPQVALSVYGAQLPDLSARGNPAVWYPFTVLLIAACWSLWRARRATKGMGWRWFVLGGGFCLASIATVYQYRDLSPSGAGIALATGTLLVQAALMAFYYGTVTRTILNPQLLIVLLLAGVSTWALLAGEQAARFFFSSTLTLAVVLPIVRGDSFAPAPGQAPESVAGLTRVRKAQTSE